MRIDLHSHVKLSKKQQFSRHFFQQSIEEAKSAGLDGIAMTEHFNTEQYNKIYETLDKFYPYFNHYYDIDGFRIYPGMEVDVAEGGHILLIGAKDAILSIREQLNPYTEKDRFIALEQLLDWADELDLLKIGAHPYRSSNPLTAHSDEVLARLDALDINGKDIFVYGLDMAKQVEQLSKQLNIRTVVGSDTHHPLQFGSVWNEFPVPIDDYAQLRSYIKQNHYTTFINNDLTIRVKSASLVKKLLKDRGPVTEAFI